MLPILRIAALIRPILHYQLSIASGNLVTQIEAGLDIQSYQHSDLGHLRAMGLSEGQASGLILH
jgi:hypothetical protein